MSEIKCYNTQVIPLDKLEHNNGQIDGLPANPRTKNKELFEKLVNSIQENPEMMWLRELIVVEHGEKYVVIAGNMRMDALIHLNTETAPCKVLPSATTAAQLQAYAIKDNASFGEWNFEMLTEEWDLKDLENWAVEVPEIKTLDEDETKAEQDDFNERDVIDSIVQPLDVWQLGRHRLMCGDSTSANDVAVLMDGAKADLVFTDPPYGMKKEAEGVLNDNLNHDDLLDFNRQWIPLSFDALKENGSWYCWGTDEPLMDIYSEIIKPMQNENKCKFRNLITWNKGAFGSGGGTGVGQAIQRSYFPADEKCLFVMCGVQGFNNNAEHFNDAYAAILNYMMNEADKVKLTAKRLQEITGVQMFGHWFSKSQFTTIPEKHYVKLQEVFGDSAFTLPWSEVMALRGESSDEFKSLKDEVMAQRAYFNNTHDMMTNVWEFGRCRGTERAECGGHATPKPIALCERAIKTSSRENEIVLDMFGGSGSTLIACEQLNRTCYSMELDPHYCDVIIARWEKATGEKAVKI